MSMSVLVAFDAKNYEIVYCVIPQVAPPLNVMDLKILHAPARLATPAISLQDFTAKLAIRFRFKPQAGSLCPNPHQSIACTFSRSCLISDFGRPRTIRVNQGKRASRFPISALTPARKSAQIISRQ